MPPLPSPFVLDLSSPDLLGDWHQRPAALPAFEPEVFWRRHGVLTAPQAVALLVGRPAALTSIRTIEAKSAAFLDATYARSGRVRLQSQTLTRAASIWRRDHEATEFRLDPRRLRRPLAPTNPLAGLASWATPEVVFEDRMLMASRDARDDARGTRQARIRTALRDGERSGLVHDVRRVRVRRLAFRITHNGAANVREPSRWKSSTLDHHALSVEAALALTWSRYGSLRVVRALRSELDLFSAVRRGRTSRRGDKLPALADLEVTYDGVQGNARRCIEVISESYRDPAIAKKVRELTSDGVDYVATSRVLALRCERVVGGHTPIFPLLSARPPSLHGVARSRGGGAVRRRRKLAREHPLSGAGSAAGWASRGTCPRRRTSEGTGGTSVSPPPRADRGLSLPSDVPCSEPRRLAMRALLLDARCSGRRRVPTPPRASRPHRRSRRSAGSR
jgi:hypothetical protein